MSYLPIRKRVARPLGADCLAYFAFVCNLFLLSVVLLYSRLYDLKDNGECPIDERGGDKHLKVPKIFLPERSCKEHKFPYAYDGD